MKGPRGSTSALSAPRGPASLAVASQQLFSPSVPPLPPEPRSPSMPFRIFPIAPELLQLTEGFGGVPGKVAALEHPWEVLELLDHIPQPFLILLVVTERPRELHQHCPESAAGPQALQHFPRQLHILGAPGSVALVGEPLPELGREAEIGIVLYPLRP